MSTSLQPAQALVAIFTEPRRVFDAIPRRTMALLPVALMLVGNVLIWIWYYQMVDFSWLQERLIAQNASVVDESSRQAAEMVITRPALLTMSITGSLLAIPALLAMLAAYFLLAGRLLGQGRSYRQWFGFVAWGTAPTLLLIPVMALQILLARSNQLAPEALNPLSLNALLFHVGSASPWHGLLNSLNLTSLWSVALLAIGLRHWTGQGWPASIVAALLPFTLVYAAWALRIVAGG